MRFRTRSLAAASIAAVVAMTAAGAVAGTAAVADETPPEARVWLTTVDRSSLLEEQAPVAFGDAASAAPTIVVDPETTYQEMDGFGASLTDSSAAVLSALSDEERDATMRKLFDPRRGHRRQRAATADRVVRLHRDP